MRRLLYQQRRASGYILAMEPIKQKEFCLPKILLCLQREPHWYLLTDQDPSSATDIHEHVPNQIVSKLQANLTRAMNCVIPHVSILAVL